MSMEPVFAALFAVLLGGESATAADARSAALMVLAAMLVVELVPRRHDRGRGPAHRGLSAGTRTRWLA